uniref:Reverse transcriptase domain-containing protein n=1 Tax=Amphimedon queenslandica TaxID=400682 RepID=A0A1X7UDA1_AMPQE
EDPLSMFIYAIGTIPLIRTIHHPTGGVKIWFADDSSACAPLSSLEKWLRKLMDVGPQFGYHPEPRKSFPVVKNNDI